MPVPSPRRLTPVACAIALVGACSSALGVPATWSVIGGDTPNAEVQALEIDGNDLWVGGGFSELPFGTAHDGVAKWNGTTWSGAGQGTGPTPFALATVSGTLYAGGNFMSAGGGAPNTFGLAQWNGTSWSSVGGVRMANSVRALARSGSTLYVGGSFYDAGVSPYLPFNRLAKWDGSTWSAVGTAWGPAAGDPNNTESVNALVVDGSGNVYAGGNFTTAGGAPADYLVKWDGTSWSSLGTGVNGEVKALKLDAAGNLYAGGTFTTAGGITVNRMAKWNGSSWSALGTGVDGTVHALEAVDYCGQSVVYAGGDFGNAGGASARRVAAWDGTQWSPVGGGVGDMLGGVRVLAAPGPSTLYAGGSFYSAWPAPSYLGQGAVTNRACAPTAATAERAPGAALVSWTNPNSGPAWDDLVVTASPGGATCTTPTATTCTVQGLTNGTPYTFTVKATNAAGDSPVSNTTGPVTPADVPTVPTAATAAAGQEQATVSWTAPASNEGSAIVGYIVTASPGGRTCTTTGATTCTVTGLTAGTAYTFTVTASNGVGASAASAATGIVVPVAPPPAPATPSTSPSAAPTVPTLRASTRVRRGVATTTGTVPAGATRITQTASTGGSVATQGFLEMARAKRATGKCTIRKRKYTCAIRLSRGTWTVTTAARGKAGVVAEGSRRVVVR